MRRFRKRLGAIAPDLPKKLDDARDGALMVQDATWTNSQEAADAIFDAFSTERRRSSDAKKLAKIMALPVLLKIEDLQRETGDSNVPEHRNYRRLMTESARAITNDVETAMADIATGLTHMRATYDQGIEQMTVATRSLDELIKDAKPAIRHDHDDLLISIVNERMYLLRDHVMDSIRRKCPAMVEQTDRQIASAICMRRGETHRHAQSIISEMPFHDQQLAIVAIKRWT